jgi:hypothetical protein
MEQAADKMGDEVCALTDVLDHRTECSGEGIRLTHMNQEARTGNSNRWWSAGRKNRAGGTGVLMGSLYEWIRWALSQIRSKTKYRNEKSRLGSTRNEISQTSHSTLERKIRARKNRYQGAGTQNDVPNSYSHNGTRTQKAQI